MLFFGIIGALLGLVSIVIAVPFAVTYATTGLVPRLPAASARTNSADLAFLSFFSQMILDTVVRGRQLRRLAIRPCARNKRSNLSRAVSRKDVLLLHRR